MQNRSYPKRNYSYVRYAKQCAFLITVMAVIAIYLYHNIETLQQDICVKSSEVNRYKTLYSQYVKHMDYISLHSSMLSYPDADTFRKSLKYISEISDVLEVSLCDMSDTANMRQITLKAKYADEHAGYRFIYYLEKLIHGVVDVQSVLIVQQDATYNMILKLNIYYFNVKEHSLARNESYEEAVKLDIDESCQFSLFQKKVGYQLNGIIGNTAIINRKRYKRGDWIGSLCVKQICDSHVMLKSKDGRIIKIALGTYF